MDEFPHPLSKKIGFKAVIVFELKLFVWIFFWGRGGILDFFLFKLLIRSKNFSSDWWWCHPNPLLTTIHVVVRKLNQSKYLPFLTLLPLFSIFPKGGVHLLRYAKKRKFRQIFQENFFLCLTCYKISDPPSP